MHKYLKGQSSPTGVNFYDHICKVKEKAGKWLKPLDKNGISHSKRIEEYLNKLIPDEFIKEKWLSPAEVFVLLYAVYLHDIGYIKDDGTIDPKDHPKRSGEKIRNNWAAYCFSSEFFPPYQNEHPRAAEAVAIVCECHAPEVVCKLNKIPQEFSDHALDSKPLNLKRLTALLRLADEADDPYIRGKASQSYRKNVVLVEIKRDIIVWHWEADKWNKGVNRQEIGAELNDQIREKEGLLKSTNEYLREFKLDKRLFLEPTLTPSPSEIQTREVKLPEIDIPTIQSVLRKGETFEGDFFKKEPEWIDFEEGFVVERKEVDEIVKKLENDTIQLVLGEPASGKSIILKNIGFKLAKENKDVYTVELKKHSGDKVKRYFDDIPEIKDEKTVFIVDDAHFQLAECEKLIRNFKTRKSRAKLIIGSRETEEISEGHPKESSEFEYLSKTDIQAKDITEKMIRGFLKRKHDFSDERIKTVSKNLERYKKDLWHLSWALKAYNPEKDSLEEKEIYEKIKDSIRKITLGKDDSGKDKFLNAEDVFLPLSGFYRFEVPIERNFLEEQLEIEEDKINQLIELSEIFETEEIGRNIMLSLIHSSVADLYFGAYQRYPDFGRIIKKRILNQREENLEYCLFYKYMISADPKNAIDVVILLGRRGEREILLKKLIEDGRVENSIEKGIDKEEDLEKIGWCMLVIKLKSEEAARKIGNRLNLDILALKIEKEEDIENISTCLMGILAASEEVALKFVNYISSRIEKEEDIDNIGRWVDLIVHARSLVLTGIQIPWWDEIPLKLANRLNIDTLSSKIEKEEDIETIRWCVSVIAEASDEVAQEIVNRINVDVLLTKIEKEEDIGKIGWCVEGIAAASEEVAQEIVNRLNPKLKEELNKKGWLK